MGFSTTDTIQKVYHKSLFYNINTSIITIVFKGVLMLSLIHLNKRHLKHNISAFTYLFESNKKPIKVGVL